MTLLTFTLSFAAAIASYVLMLDVGLGLRIFITRWFAATLEVRDYIFFESLENPSIATGFDKSGKPLAQDQSTWLADSKSFTNNVQAQLGLSFFLPVSWTYKKAK